MFLNLRPKQIAAIPWGWRNEIVNGVPVVVEHPGKVEMPELENYYDWSDWEVGFPHESWPVHGVGTRDNKSVLTTAIRFLGWEGIGAATKADFEKIGQEFSNWNARVLQEARGAINFFMVGDDVAGNNGLLVSPEFWREYVKPIFTEMFFMARYYGCQTIFHSDGDLSKLLDDLIDLNFDILNCRPVGFLSNFKNGNSWNGIELWIESEDDMVYRGYLP